MIYRSQQTLHIHFSQHDDMPAQAFEPNFSGYTDLDLISTLLPNSSMVPQIPQPSALFASSGHHSSDHYYNTPVIKHSDLDPPYWEPRPRSTVYQAMHGTAHTFPETAIQSPSPASAISAPSLPPQSPSDVPQQQPFAIRMTEYGRRFDHNPHETAPLETKPFKE